MEPIFCCSNLNPYMPRRLDHELKFQKFLDWVKEPQPINNSVQELSLESTLEETTFAVQVVRQVNYGPLESKRYFSITSPVGDSGSATFREIIENDLVQANFKKLNSFKNFKCSSHNKFFEINLYQKDPVNKHHWRADVSRPAGQIDL